MPDVALAWGSRSISRTFWSYAARAAERLMAVVVLPTPPFWLAIAMIRAMRSGGLSSRTRYRPIDIATFHVEHRRAGASAALSKGRGGSLIRAGDRNDHLERPVSRRDASRGLVGRPEEQEAFRPQKRRVPDRDRQVSNGPARRDAESLPADFLASHLQNLDPVEPQDADDVPQKRCAPGPRLD